MAKKYKFIDLFAGIGGFHLGLHKAGAKCVFASEWDKAARITYEHNLKKIDPKLFSKSMFVGDITKVSPGSIPDFDILCGGFPCQPFSNAGHGLGFEDPRGNLFFHIRDIIRAKQPSAFFLENVRGLIAHDEGQTFKEVQRVIQEELGYSFYWKLVRGTDFGVPQHRPRVYMVGFRNPNIEFEFPAPIPLKFTMSDVFGAPCSRQVGFTLRCGGRGSAISDRRNWDRYLVEGREVQLTSDKAKLMQGFPPDYEFPVTEAQAMKQLGNSVVVPGIERVGREIVRTLRGASK